VIRIFPKKVVEILLVDDNSGDIVLTKELLTEARYPYNINVASSGAVALQFLRKEGPFMGAPTADLVILDINMPGMSGLEVLRTIRTDVHLESLPVVILSSSDSDDDIRKSYELQANCYLTKPENLEQFATLIQSIDDFWLSVVRFPRHRDY
jgi:CheY-like chemotaxis protein